MRYKILCLRTYDDIRRPETKIIPPNQQRIHSLYFKRLFSDIFIIKISIKKTNNKKNQFFFFRKLVVRIDYPGNAGYQESPLRKHSKYCRI